MRSACRSTAARSGGAASRPRPWMPTRSSMTLRTAWKTSPICLTTSSRAAPGHQRRFDEVVSEAEAAESVPFYRARDRVPAQEGPVRGCHGGCGRFRRGRSRRGRSRRGRCRRRGGRAGRGEAEAVFAVEADADQTFDVGRGRRCRDEPRSSRAMRSPSYESDLEPTGESEQVTEADSGEVASEHNASGERPVLPARDLVPTQEGCVRRCCR